MTTTIASILPPGRTQYLDLDGNPLVGGSVYYYQPGTTTPKNTWKDAFQLILNTNPVVLDDDGSALVYGAGGYSMALYDVNGNLIYTALTQDLLGQDNTLAGANTFTGANTVSAAGSWQFNYTASTPFAGPIQVQGGRTIRSGAGSPNGSVTGANGDIYLRTDGSGGSRLYVCSGTTTWAAVATV